MKITKYEHACLVIEKEGMTLIVDPGVYTDSLPELTTVKAVVVTHIHPDHFDEEKVRHLLELNPDAVLFTTEEVAAKLPDLSDRICTSHGDCSMPHKDFKLTFCGTEHAEIHRSLPRNQNIGVLIENSVYYPGDSLTLPPESTAIRVLAVPAHAPWLKASEAIDFMTACKPELAFSTHNHFLSADGVGLMHRILGNAASSVGVNYQALDIGQSITL